VVVGHAGENPPAERSLDEAAKDQAHDSDYRQRLGGAGGQGLPDGHQEQDRQPDKDGQGQRLGQGESVAGRDPRGKSSDEPEEGRLSAGKKGNKANPSRHQQRKVHPAQD
jgi:hypothetical protein